MNDFESTLKYLYDLQMFGMKLGLDHTLSLLEFMGNPHRTFPTIHVAGTNGKGSTCAMLASIARSAGFRTGLYTSPHIAHFSERIRVDDEPIAEQTIVDLTERMRPRIDELRCTFFEATTVMALEHFAQSQVDIAIIETGLGGRLDATNVVHPLVSVITNIGLDHTEHLGPTVRDIAFEKGGIIKEQTPCVIGPVDETCREVFDALALERHAPLYYLNRETTTRILHGDTDGSTFDLHLRPGPFRYEGLSIRLAGSHQVTNAALAVVALWCQNRFLISEKAVREGLQNAVWKGRLQWLEPNMLVDAAHNPAGLSQLRTTLEELYRPSFRRIVLIIGMLADKDCERAMEAILPICDEVITVTPDSPRALPAEDLARIVRRRNGRAVAAGTVADALRLARKETSRDDLIVITGSHFVLSGIGGLLN